MNPPSLAVVLRTHSRATIVTIAIVGCAAFTQIAHSATPADLLAGYETLAGSKASPVRGQQIFMTRPQSRDWSCASCHGALPTQPGKHASTGKPIAALAPEFNPERFNDAARVDKWFRRNCNDVMGRECTAAEKADVLSWLMTLKP